MSTTPLFPTPSLAPSQLSPPRIPGISPESTNAMKETLSDNHKQFHVFINDLGFHNHASHRVLALWALGASADVIKARYYKQDYHYLKAAIKTPEAISDKNFDEHLGDERYYSGYVEFFASYIEEHGMGKALEDWVLSSRANLGEGDLPADKQPRMLARFVSGVIHPFIHTGHGSEFGLPGMMAEGLAQCAVHNAQTSALVPPSTFDGAQFTSFSGEKRTLTVFDILGQVHDELHGKTPKATTIRDFDNGLGQHAEFILKAASQWELDANKLGQTEYLHKKIEELALLVVSLYGVAGWTLRGNKDFRADFFLMHCVTSSVFLPSHCAAISPLASARLLHTYFVTTLALYAFLQCPTLDFVGFYASSSQEPSTDTNPWFSIIQVAIDHHDEHVTKIQRALAAWASHFGSKKFNFSSSSSAGIVGLEHLNGGLFLRTAQLTARRVGPAVAIPSEEAAEAEARGRPTEWDFADLSDD